MSGSCFRTIVGLPCLLLACCGAIQNGNRMEVHQLEANADRWLNKQVYVTGRFASASADRVRLTNSEIDFHLERASRRIHSGTERLEMVGSLNRKGRKLTFEVSSVRELPSEMKEFNEKKKKIAAGDHAELYELIRWAQERSEWYGDKRLKRLTEEASLQAFDWEVDEAARRGDVGEMLSLAQEAEEQERSPTDVLQIQHRAVWVARDSLPEADARAVEALATQASEMLPEMDKPVSVEQLAALSEYLKSPVESYAKATEEQVAQMHRALWVSLTVEAMLLRLAGDADPGELAMRVQRLVPERPDLWRRFRLAELDGMAADPDLLTRGGLISVRDGYQQLELPERAAAIVDRWLAEQRLSISGDDAEGHLQLAADYRSLVGDESAAAELYQQALGIEPDLSEAREGLQELGYDLVDGQWQLVEELDAATMRDRRRERRGELGVGDSEAEVLRRFPAPDRIARTVSGTSIIEQWIYDGPPSFYIYLRRDGASGRARVIATHGAPASR